MQWFFIALSAPFLWALVNVSDKFLVEKYANEDKHSPWALVLFFSLASIFIAIIIGFFAHNIFAISLTDKLLLITSAVLTIFWTVLYFFALGVEDVSSVVPWFLAVPIFGYVLGYLFLGETLSLFQQIGSIIILLGVAILFFDFSNAQMFRFKWKVALYMVPICLIIALIGVIFKYVTVAGQFWVSSFWIYATLGASGILIFIMFPNYRRDFLTIIKKGKMKIFGLNMGKEIATIVGNFLTNYAILLAPVAMVYLVGSLQPVIVFLLALFCTKFFPSITKENLSKRILLPKILAIVIIVAGSIVLFI